MNGAPTCPQPSNVDYCKPTTGYHPTATGFTPPPVPAPNGSVPYNSNQAMEPESTTIAAFPTNPAVSNAPGTSLYSTSALPVHMWLNTSAAGVSYDTAWNNSDPVTPYSMSNHSGKPDLQTQFQKITNQNYGTINNVDGWCNFLNYYFWMQACVDFQFGTVISDLRSAQSQAFANNTVVILTADHGDFGGSHGLHTKGGALYDEAINIPLYIQFPNQNALVPRSYVCSSVDILPLLYSLALGNESWRTNQSDIIYYLNGRESILDAIMLGTENAQQRRLSTFPLTYPQGSASWQKYQPYVIHTQDEYWQLQNAQSPIACHAVAYRTVDNTLNVPNLPSTRDGGPFGGGKLGVYSLWNSGATTPIINNNQQQQSQQFEFYNYQPKNTTGDSGPLPPNLGETGNDYWLSLGANTIAQKYVNAFNVPGYISELSTIPTQVCLGHAKALQAWLDYVSQSATCHQVTSCPS